MNAFKKYLIAFWGIIILGLGSLGLIIFLVSIGAFGSLPTFYELENPKSQLATEIYADDGTVLGKYYTQNRSNIEYENLPKALVDALIATEDARFYSHAGVDGLALLRVIYGVVKLELEGGGSTISQQLAKNLFERGRLSLPKLVIRKFQEWVIAAKLEKAYTKEEIITMYFNTVPFSDNAFGIESAARTYFNKPVDSLKYEEAAVLVGMLKAPTYYNPRRNPERSQRRRNVVLMQMEKYGKIDLAMKDSLQAIPLTIDFNRTNHVEGLAPYFRAEMRKFLKNWCKNNLKPDGSQYNIDKDGLRIYTTINARMQGMAEVAMKEHLTELQSTFFDHWKNRDPWKDFPSELKRAYRNNDFYRRYKQQGLSADSIEIMMNTKQELKAFSWQGEVDTLMTPKEWVIYHRMFLQSGMMSMDPESGHVKAWVGGIDFKYFQYDHVNIGTKRQVGSTFKPFVYAVAIDQKGYSPCFKVPNELVTFEKDNPRWAIPEDWTPKNSDAKYGGMMSLTQGLANSVNTITAYLMHEMSPRDVVALVRNMGMEQETDIQEVPSICLGTPDISVFEMVGAYATFANLGIYTQPIFVTRIEDNTGNILEEFYPKRKEEAMSEETAYVMTRLLQGVVQGGSAVRLRYKYGLDLNIAGKTGTTQNHSDGWFVGYTPELVTGVWTGCEDRFVRFRNIRNGQGANMALPIWAKYVKRVYEDESLGYDKTLDFKKPIGRVNIELDCSKYETNNNIDPQEDLGGQFE